MLCTMCLFLTACAPTARKLVLWDGREHTVGVGWVAPGASDMSITTTTQPSSAPATSPAPVRTIVFHAAHPKTFVEAGWQWAPWWPAPKGTDITGYKTLVLVLRITGPQLPRDLLISLASPGDHCCTQRVSARKYAPALFDGQLHTLRIPLSDLFTPTMKLDPKHCHQIILGTWNANGDFQVHITALAFEPP